MARVLATSRYATDLLLRAPGDGRPARPTTPSCAPRPAAALRAEAVATVRRHDAGAPSAVAAVRALRRRELLRTAVADLLGLPDGRGDAARR